MRRKVWVWSAVALVLVGALLVVLSVPGLTSRVAAHEEVVFGGDPVLIGPYDFHGGRVVVWIEDYYGYHGDNQDFGLSIAGSEGGHRAWSPDGRETRIIDGTRCVLVGGFKHLIEEEWSIEIHNNHGSTDITNSTVEVYIFEGPNAVEMVLFGAGIVMLTLGIVWLLFFRSGRRTRSMDDEE